MAVGDPITAARYNIIQGKLANVLGTGSGDSGYGQTLASSQVAVSQLIEDSDMNTLRTDIRTAYLHQNNSYPTLPAVTTSDLVTDNNSSGAGAGLLNSYGSFETLATNVETNRNTISASRLQTDNTAATYQRTSAWNATIVGTFTVTFASVTAGRHFFNTGGAVQINMSVTAGTSKNDDWNTLFTTNMGTFTFANLASSRSGTSGTINAIHYTTLTTTFQTVYSSAASAVYTSNNFNIQARFTDATPGAVIEFQITLNDATVGGIDENVNANLDIQVLSRKANSTLSNPITIAAPAYSAMSGTIL